MKILIIDDEKGITDIYQETFTKAGFEVAVSNQGEDGLMKARLEQPDIIILDIIMPEINGLDVLKCLKSEEATRTIPVVLLTNLPSEMSADKAKALGASEYLVKAEYDPADIVKIVKSLINKE